MPAIISVVTELKKFLHIAEVKEIHDNFLEKIFDHNKLRSYDEVAIEAIAELRHKLINLYANFISDSITIPFLAHAGLVALAEFKPISTFDAITGIALERTDPDRIPLSNGRWTTLTSIRNQHLSREPRYKLGETLEEKRLEINGEWVHPFDIYRIFLTFEHREQPSLEIRLENITVSLRRDYLQGLSSNKTYLTVIQRWHLLYESNMMLLRNLRNPNGLNFAASIANRLLGWLDLEFSFQNQTLDLEHEVEFWMDKINELFGKEWLKEGDTKEEIKISESRDSFLNQIPKLGLRPELTLEIPNI